MTLRRPIVALLLILSAVFLACAGGTASQDGGPGFRTERQLIEHYAKHGHEFGKITKAEYLKLAQELRDAQVGGAILQAVRSDGVRTKFDKNRGYFGAYNKDRTIRTFFVPNDGVRYFYRQAGRPR